MDEQKQDTPNPFAQPEQTPVPNDPTNVPVAPNVGTNEEAPTSDGSAPQTDAAPVDHSGNATQTSDGSVPASTDSNATANVDASTGTDAGNAQAADQSTSAPAVTVDGNTSSSSTGGDAPAVTDSGNAQAAPADSSSTSPQQSSDESATATSDVQAQGTVAPATPAESVQAAGADADATTLGTDNLPNVRTTPVETAPAQELGADAASAPQPPVATVVATGDPDTPAKVVQAEQQATVPDPDPNAAEGAVIPNPDVVTGFTADIPSPINPDATNSPAPISPVERVAHLEIQQNTPDGQSVTATQISGDYAASAQNQAEAQGQPTTHRSILQRLMLDMEGIAAMGKSEIIAMLGIIKARYDEIEGNKDAE